MIDLRQLRLDCIDECGDIGMADGRGGAARVANHSVGRQRRRALLEQNAGDRLVQRRRVPRAPSSSF